MDGFYCLMKMILLIPFGRPTLFRTAFRTVLISQIPTDLTLYDFFLCVGLYGFYKKG